MKHLPISALFLGGLTLCGPLTLSAEVAPNPSMGAAPDQPLVQKLSGGDYQVGKVRFNKNTRIITIPARTNIVNPDTIIEYLFVHLNGEKTHEALLTTEADPTNINIALKLLNYKESQELFRIVNKDGTLSDKFPEPAEDIKKAARFDIQVTWLDKGVTKTRPITHWLRHTGNEQKMPNTPWVYNGSYVHGGKFKAKLTGSIIAILPDAGAIANYPGNDRHDDTLWTPAVNLPVERSELTVTIKPWKN